MKKINGRKNVNQISVTAAQLNTKCVWVSVGARNMRANLILVQVMKWQASSFLLFHSRHSEREKKSQVKLFFSHVCLSIHPYMERLFAA